MTTRGRSGPPSVSGATVGYSLRSFSSKMGRSSGASGGPGGGGGGGSAGGSGRRRRRRRRKGSASCNGGSAPGSPDGAGNNGGAGSPCNGAGHANAYSSGGGCANRTLDNQLKTRRKVAKMLIAVVTMFAVNFFPVHLIPIVNVSQCMFKGSKCSVFLFVRPCMLYDVSSGRKSASLVDDAVSD